MRFIILIGALLALAVSVGCEDEPPKSDDCPPGVEMPEAATPSEAATPTDPRAC